MNKCRGSAIVLAMFLLLLLSALGMILVSVPVGTGESASRYHRVAVARNMARAGANAAIARFPLESPVGSPYVRRIPVGSDVTGRYSVTSIKSTAEIGSATAPSIQEYEIVSVGSATDLRDGDVRVVARVRYGPNPERPRARILEWEEYGSR
jgi:hypothetical protein